MQNQNLGLTDRQRQVLRCVFEKKTRREMLVQLGLTGLNGINDHLVALEKKGAILRRRTDGGWMPHEVTDAGLAELGLVRCRHCRGEGTIGL